MLPAFDDLGYLPPGVHRATIDEIDERFGRNSEIRRAQMESVRWMLDLAIRADVLRVVLNGSFVTDIIEPNDVDCVLLIEFDNPHDAVAEKELRNGLPFLNPKLVGQTEFNDYLTDTFATDRMGERKGMVEVIL